ncbi:MAG: cellulose synthase operon protein YhjQ [Comamonadaceae bacterium CG2_30_57_122]|nr:MAG: cellulose synthase operon protein YhjQ [Comamonadaceae bacterium CG2_30_57_122]
MSIIGIVSMKGGVGKTSTTANLAAALAAKLGEHRVAALDLDPQNALHWHFGLDNWQTSGISQRALNLGDWTNAAISTPFNVVCLPYGDATETERETFELLLAEQPDWIGSQIKRAKLDHDAVVLIDTPPGPSVYLHQVFACADLVLMVLLPDAGSYATIPAMESWLEQGQCGNPLALVYYVLNQTDQGEPLNRDAAQWLQQRLGKRMAPIAIHADEAVSEALAFQQPVLAYAPYGQASHDFAQLALWVINTLNQ